MTDAAAAGSTPAAGPGAALHVKLTVTCAAGHHVAEFLDSIAEARPFFCEECDVITGDGDLRAGEFPWRITTRIVAAETIAMLNRAVYLERGDGDYTGSETPPP